MNDDVHEPSYKIHVHPLLRTGEGEYNKQTRVQFGPIYEDGVATRALFLWLVLGSHYETWRERPV